MKNISMLFVGVLFCAPVFANETDKPDPSSSSVVVTNSSGSSLFKLYYKVPMEGDVNVSILNQSGKVLFKEKMKKTNGFVRPYNFEGLDEGDYTIQIENDEGKRIEKVHYSAGKIEKLINIVRLAEDGKYLLSVRSAIADKVNINIYNENHELIHSQSQFVNREFAEVINLKDFTSFTIEVTDSRGLLKTMKY